MPDLLAALCARGRAAFPDLKVADDWFVRHLAGTVIRTDLPVKALGDLAIEDLFLVCACLRGVAGAVDVFQRRCRAPVLAAIASVAKSPATRDEIEQQLRDVLLVGTRDAPAKIASYSGQGALGKWAGVAAQRLALMMIRSDKAEARARDGAAAEAMASTADPELAFIKEKYRAPFRQALEEALAALPDRERLVMRLNLVSGVSVEGIGKMYGVSQSTASRWLARARETVIALAQQRLRAQLGVSPDEMQSLAALVVSQLELSVSRALYHS